MNMQTDTQTDQRSAGFAPLGGSACPLRFEQGQDFHSLMYGGTFRCVRRWFEGTLEMVELAFLFPDGKLGHHFERSARAMQPGFNVREVRGGVTRPEMCRHDTGWITTESYGEICPLCGEVRQNNRI